jgi:hypothetical protein
MKQPIRTPLFTSLYGEMFSPYHLPFLSQLATLRCYDFIFWLFYIILSTSRPQWPRGLRHVWSWTARKLGSWVPDLLEACTYAFFHILLWPCDGPIPRLRSPTETSKWIRSLNSEPEDSRAPHP